MASAFALEDAQSFLRDHRLDGWLLEDFHHNNPVFWQVVGGTRHTTRRAFLLIPLTGTPRFLLHMIDVERLSDLGWPIDKYLSREDQDEGLRNLLANRPRVAMEYSPDCALPVVSRVDAGTVEQVRGLGVEVVPSGDVLQFAVARWTREQLETHQIAARAVVDVVHEAFALIARRLEVRVDEVAIRDFIRDRFAALGLVAEDGPSVSVNAHSGDPHYEPTPGSASIVQRGDWVLIDLWAKQTQLGAVYGDSTWVGFVGRDVPELHRRVFDSVLGARDAAIDLLESSWKLGGG